MPKLRVVSGKSIVTAFKKLGFFVTKQRGSHIKLQRTLSNKTRQTLTIPNHNEIDKGTLRSIINQASRYIPENELKDIFYH